VPLVAWLALSIVILNVGVSVVVARSKAFSRSQKLAQCLVVWIVPLVGSVAIFFISRHIARESVSGVVKPPAPEPGPDAEVPQLLVDPLNGLLRDDRDS
jgi:hypothetical protein